MRSRTGRVVVAVALAAAAAVTLPVAPAAASATHVGIVVRFADGSSQTGCTTSGGSGLAVLARRFSVVVGQPPSYAGFVLTINGRGTTSPDSNHYWSYWHSTGGGAWTYSGVGAGSYTPKAGTVEGWSYVNGTNTAPRPPSVTYAALCGSADPKPAVSSTHRPAPTQSTATRTRPVRTTVPRTTAAPPPTIARSSGATTPPVRPTAARSVDARGRRTIAKSSNSVSRQSDVVATKGQEAGRSPTGSTGTSRATVSTSPVAGSIRAADPPSGRSAAGLPKWGTALALLVVLALGGSAWWRTRQRPE